MELLVIGLATGLVFMHTGSIDLLPRILVSIFAGVLLYSMGLGVIASIVRDLTAAPMLALLIGLALGLGAAYLISKARSSGGGPFNPFG